MNFLADKNITESIAASLERLGNVFYSTELNIGDTSVSTHPDMQIHFVEEDAAFCAPQVYDYYKETLPAKIALHKGCAIPKCTYPYDCAYNIAVIGDVVICNTKYADRFILEYYTEKKRKIINVNQGYTKCNICPVTENSYITEDAGIYKILCEETALKGLLLAAGSIRLTGFKYGFIGGATGKAGNNLLLCGSLNSINVKKCINEFLVAENVNLVELSEDKPMDYGSIISF